MLLDAMMQEDEERIRLTTQCWKKKHITEKMDVTEKEPAFEKKTPDRW